MVIRILGITRSLGCFCSGSFQSKSRLAWILIQHDLMIHSGAWLVGSGYMIYVCGSEILQGLEIAAGLPHKKTL